MSLSSIEVSVVIPVYNEKQNLSELYQRLSKVLKSTGKKYEIIFINDGSTDNTSECIEQICKEDSSVKLIELSRNFGHMIALTAGLDFAKGHCICTMDGDLQHPPELIPELIKLWEQGYEIVNTIREDTPDISLFKRKSSQLFYWIIGKISSTEITTNAADFRLLDKKVVESLKNMREHARFLRGLVGWLGFKKTHIRFKADPRFAGKPKYSLRRMVSFAIKGIVSFSVIPLRFATLMGFLVSVISFLYATYAIYLRLFLKDAVIRGWTSVLASILFLGGIQLIAIGILGEYIAKIYEEVKKRPLYIIRRVIEMGNNDE